MAKKILICDDEEGIRESLKLILADHYELVLTDNSEQCLEFLKNDPAIGAVLLDIKMPKTHGLDVLKEIKEKYPAQKVIIITGYRSVETASEAAGLGADGYIVKPFESKGILDSIRKNIATTTEKTH